MTALIELYANNANTVLANNITSSSTSIPLSPGTGSEFPSPVVGISFFRLVITGASSPNTVEEICYVTQRSGDTLTVLRGQEGTTAVAWSVNDLVYNAVTSGTLNQFMQPYYGLDTTLSNAYVIQNSVQGAYANGTIASFSSAYSNTITNPTLNVNGNGAATIKNADGSALTVGQIQSNTLQVCYYNANDSSWRLQTPSYGQVISNLGYVPVNKGGDSMSGALTNSYGFVGPLNGSWAYMPSGTRLTFAQASAPTGWTQDTSFNDCAIRVVSGSGGGSGGSVGFSSAFVNQAVAGSVSISPTTGSVGSTSLSVDQLPPHSHAISISDPGHAHGNVPLYIPSGDVDRGGMHSLFSVDNLGATAGSATGISAFATNTGSGNPHSHSISFGSQTASFSGNSINLSVKYIDSILCTKN